MIISRRWLLDFLPSAAVPADDEEFAALLTARGVEVESCRVLNCRGLVAGEVLATSLHPSSDKQLQVCKVRLNASSGNCECQIICGAPNVAAGQLVVVAPPGAVVGGHTIQAREFRGVTSEGMICSSAEIGIGGDADGIMVLQQGEVEVGESLDEYLQLPDAVFDAGITPNRGDCLSHLGIAREIAAAADIALPDAQTHKYKADAKQTFPVEIVSPDACPCYGSVVVRGVDASKPSPWRIRARLERCGVRAISAAVDITNYVMLETGQALHAFDLNKLSGGIRVRMAKEGEEVMLLNGQTVHCDADTLVIADHKQAVALAGVMGGMDSSVTDATTDILLEGAFFAPSCVRGKTSRYGLNSEAAFRFERGCDPQMPPQALAMAAKLLTDICGGSAGPVTVTGSPPPAAAPIKATGEQIRGILGVEELNTPTAAKLLNASGIETKVSKDQLTSQPPSWRFDLELAADLAEEVIRGWGYDNLPETPPPGGINIAPMPPRPFAPEHARRRLSALGFNETVTFAFVPPQWEDILQSGRGKPLQIQNPINREMSVMRTTLLGGLIDRALFNLNHKQNRMRLFEIGRCFNVDAVRGGFKASSASSGAGSAAGGAQSPDGEESNFAWTDEQPLYAAGIALGAVVPAQWGAETRECDFFDMKGWLEMFLQPAGGVEFSTADPRPAFLHPQQSANVTVGADGVLIGALGVLHPQVAAHFGFRRPPVVFELKLQELSDMRRLTRAADISRFPPSFRDLSVVSSAAAGEVLQIAKEAAPDNMYFAAALFDLYRDDKMTGGKTCYGIRLTMQGIDRNLTEEDIRRALDGVCAALQSSGMELRK